MFNQSFNLTTDNKTFVKSQRIFRAFQQDSKVAEHYGVLAFLANNINVQRKAAIQQ